MPLETFTYQEHLEKHSPFFWIYYDIIGCEFCLEHILCERYTKIDIIEQRDEIGRENYNQIIVERENGLGREVSL